MFVDFFTQQYAVDEAINGSSGLLLFRDVGGSVQMTLLQCLTQTEVDLWWCTIVLLVIKYDLWGFGRAFTSTISLSLWPMHLLTKVRRMGENEWCCWVLVTSNRRWDFIFIISCVMVLAHRNCLRHYLQSPQQSNNPRSNQTFNICKLQSTFQNKVEQLLFIYNTQRNLLICKSMPEQARHYFKCTYNTETQQSTIVYLEELVKVMEQTTGVENNIISSNFLQLQTPHFVLHLTPRDKQLNPFRVE